MKCHTIGQFYVSGKFLVFFAFLIWIPWYRRYCEVLWYPWFTSRIECEIFNVSKTGCHGRSFASISRMWASVSSSTRRSSRSQKASPRTSSTAHGKKAARVVLLMTGLAAVWILPPRFALILRSGPRNWILIVKLNDCFRKMFKFFN